MTAENFAYWLQGFFEMTDPGPLSKMQAQIIQDHLALVLDKQTPDRKFVDINAGDMSLEDLQKAVDRIRSTPPSRVTCQVSDIYDGDWMNVFGTGIKY